MKIITKKIYIITLAVFLLTSCSDFLNEANPNYPNETNSWSTESEALNALATVYSPIRGQMYGFWGAYTGFRNQNVRGDDVYHPAGEDAYEFAAFTNSPSSGQVSDDWAYAYKGIARANTFLENIDRVPFVNDGEDARKNAMKGEAYFLRAWNYFMLVINWGDVPLRLKQASLEDRVIASSPEADVWKQIISDLKEAEKLLPDKRDQTEYGRVTKGAAIAYLGKSYVYNKQWQDAFDELNKLEDRSIISTKYELVEDPDYNYDEKHEFNSESLFEFNYANLGGTGTWSTDDASTAQWNVLAVIMGTQGGWEHMQATKFIVDEFTKEPRPSGSDSKWDKRMYSTFFFKYSDYNDVKPDAVWYGNKPFDDLWAEKKDGEIKRKVKADTIISDNLGKCRFLIKKWTAYWSSKESPDWDGSRNENNVRVMRYADAVLLRAEAAAQLGTKDAEANADLKLIRDRAGLEEKTFSGKDEIMKEIEHQRLLEFWMEGQRFHDMKRWYTTEQMVEKFAKNRRNSIGANTFKEKFRYFPIPSSEINTNTLVQQHPLWK
ncbi:MAG: RagB/SusD family nutrient uptake outer membrane protein [Prevotella sp.]|jgi:hypothetical protein|nr:RagB/SusD family nutrient uptake outer membrane protein [Prevotella sp.]